MNTACLRLSALLWGRHWDSPLFLTRRLMWRLQGQGEAGVSLELYCFLIQVHAFMCCDSSMFCFCHSEIIFFPSLSLCELLHGGFDCRLLKRVPLKNMSCKWGAVLLTWGHWQGSRNTNVFQFILVCVVKFSTHSLCFCIISFCFFLIFQLFKSKLFFHSDVIYMLFWISEIALEFYLTSFLIFFIITKGHICWNV